MEAKADLHTHTIHSDGALTPRELLDKARAVGIGILSITDHDSVNGIDEAMSIGEEIGVEVIPGAELSATCNGSEIHILGYFLDVHSEALLSALAIYREERLKRVERIVDKLNRMNVPLTLESVLASAGNGSVGRPHVAAVLVNEGYATSFHQAFHKYIGDGRPAYEKKSEVTPQETVRLIAEAGGLSFLAHPGRAIDEKTLIELIGSGIDGIEVYHPSHSPELVKYYRGIVNEYCLLESGGSDFHGGIKADDSLFGRVGMPVASVDVMRRRLFSN